MCAMCLFLNPSVPLEELGEEGRKTKLTGFLKSSKIALSILFRASISSPDTNGRNIQDIIIHAYSIKALSRHVNVENRFSVVLKLGAKCSPRKVITVEFEQ